MDAKEIAEVIIAGGDGTAHSYIDLFRNAKAVSTAYLPLRAENEVLKAQLAASAERSMLLFHAKNEWAARAAAAEKQVAAMRGTLEHIGKSELMGIQYARRIALFALQPAPEPAAPNSSDSPILLK